MNIWTLFRRDPAKRFPILYSVVCKSGLIALTGANPVHFRWKAVITEESTTSGDLNEVDWEKFIRSHIPLIIHNALYCGGFPTDGDFVQIMSAAERDLREAKDSPWVALIYSASESQACLSIEYLLKEADEPTKIALGAARAGFERLMSQQANEILLWCRANRSKVDLWFARQSAFCA